MLACLSLVLQLRVVCVLSACCLSVVCVLSECCLQLTRLSEQILYVNNCNLGSIGTWRLFNTLARNEKQQLKELQISHNRLQEEDIVEMYHMQTTKIVLHKALHGRICKTMGIRHCYVPHCKSIVDCARVC